jgi:ABC-type branched-subunit amino acid transport system substrate-binding protein
MKPVISNFLKKTAVPWIVFTGLVFGCFTTAMSGEPGKSDTPAKDNTKGKVAAPLKQAVFNGKRIGCLMPETGAYSSYGISARKGFDVAYLSTMADGNHSWLKVEYRDTGSDPQKTKKAVRELAQLGVSAIVGPVGPSEDAAREAQALGIPIITLTGKDGITTLGDCVFRHFLTQNIQVKSVLEYAFNTLELKRFAVLYPDEPYGRDMTRLFEAEVKRRGGSVVASEVYAPKTTDFGKQIKKISAVAGKKPAGTGLGDEYQETKSGIDGIFIPDSAETVGLILPQLHFYDINDAILLGTNLWHSDKLIGLAGKYLQQAVIPDGFFVESQDPRVIHFMEKFGEAYDGKPGFVEAVAYDTAMAVFQVLDQNPKSFREVKQMLVNQGGVRGVTGVTAFEPSGEADKMIYLLSGNAEGFVEIAR